MLTVVLALTLGQGEALTKFTFTGISLKAPRAWPVSAEDETGKEWASNDERAQMAFNAYPVEPIRPAKACVKQLVEAISGEGFSNVTVGGQPAAKKISTDFIAEKEEDKTEENKVTTTTLVGCNGKTKWLLTFANRTADGAKSGALLKRVIDSITYTK